MTDDARLWQIFLDVQSGLPRQGPGAAEHTRRALAACEGLTTEPAVLDVGCGPGLQTMTLAAETTGPVLGVDRVPAYLHQLTANAAAAGLEKRVLPLVADMNDLPFERNTFDLIWSEGAAYIMGFAEAMAAWRPLLRPGGYLAATELVWLKPNPPEEAVTFWNAEYPPMTTVEKRLADVHAAGYTVVEHFSLPDAAWWDDYYTPLAN